MSCPQCGCDTYVTDTRHAAHGIRRRRVCSRCQHRFSTIEMVADAWREISNAKRVMNAVRASMRTSVPT